MAVMIIIADTNGNQLKKINHQIESENWKMVNMPQELRLRC